VFDGRDPVKPLGELAELLIVYQVLDGLAAGTNKHSDMGIAHE
jgi:hypothetical protein